MKNKGDASKKPSDQPNRAVSMVFVLYLLGLIWSLLFKFGDFPLPRIGEFYVNLEPFARSSGRLEILANLLIFVPFGLLGSFRFQRLRTVLYWAILLSLAIESLQFLTNIGAADITDWITNSLGALLGVGLYTVGLVKKAETALILCGLCLLFILYMTYHVNYFIR